MKLKDKISWIMGRLQRSLFPALEECCASPLTKQEKWLVKVLEIVEIEKHISLQQAVDGQTCRRAQNHRAMLCGKGSLSVPAYADLNQ